MDRSYVNGILPKRLDEYMLEATNDLTINEQNLHDKTFLRPALGAKWLRYSLEETKYVKAIEEKIENLRLEIKKKLFEKQQMAIEDATPEASRLISVKAERLIINSSTYNELKQKLAEQNDIIRFIEETQKLISQMGFDIKNAIDILKIENI